MHWGPPRGRHKRHDVVSRNRGRRTQHQRRRRGERGRVQGEGVLLGEINAGRLAGGVVPKGTTETNVVKVRRRRGRGDLL